MEYNKIICGDCLEVMKGIPDNSIDLIFTSPPYKNSYEGIGINRGRKSLKYHYNNDVGEPLYTIEDFASLSINKLKDDGFFLLNLGFNRDSGALRPFYIIDRFRKYKWFCPDILIWHKQNPIPNTAYQLTNAYEYVFILTKYPSYKLPIDKREYIHNVFCSPVEKGETEHNAAFHIDLAKFIISKFSRNNDLVLDPFIGSGTTAIACKELGRRYIGIDTDIEYCELSRRRIKAIPELLF